MILNQDGDAMTYQVQQRIAGSITTASGTATQTIDWSSADVFPFVLGYNTTFVFSNAKIGQKIRLVLTQDGTGSRTGTFPAGCLFVGGSKTLTTTASAIDTVDVLCVAVGVYHASLLKAYA